MKKLWLAVGAAIGFVLGSRAGRAPYEQLEAKARQVAGRPDVKRTVDAASDKVSSLATTAVSSASDKVSVLTERVSAKLPGNNGASPQEPTQDPQDKAFGAAVSRDQDVVDELAKKGVTEDQLSDEPTQHPRAGGKAEPA